MRGAGTGLALLALLLAGCERKPPDFDQRYDHARTQLEASAAAIDRDIAASASASDAADTAPDAAQKPGG